MIEADNTNDILSKTQILNPRKLFSIFIPLGENSIIKLTDNFRVRKDLSIIDTDLYNFIEISFREFNIKFYSKGLVIFEKKTNDDTLANLLSKIEVLATSIP